MIHYEEPKEIKMNERQTELLLQRIGMINQSLGVIALAHALGIGGMIVLALAWLLS